MPFMVWNDRLSVGIEAVDADHRTLLSLINELYDAIQAGRGRDELDDLLDRMVEYFGLHFAHESDLFDGSEYPAASAHRQEHERMKAWLVDTRDRIRRDSLSGPSLEVMTFMKDWLFDHFFRYDQESAPYLKANVIHGAMAAGRK